MLFVDTLRCTVTNWTRSSKSAEFEYEDGQTTFQSFRLWVKGNLMKPHECDFNIYFLADPTASVHRQKINNLDELKLSIEQVLKDESLKSGLYASISFTSPEKPPDDDSVSSSLTSGSNSSARGSQQKRFSNDVLKRDGEECVFCADRNVDNLEAAHIIDVAKGKSACIYDTNELLESCQLLSLYDIANGLTLCRTCHRVFDAHLCCIDSEGIIRVADAILTTEDKKLAKHWKKLDNKPIKMPPRQYQEKGPSFDAIAYKKKQFDDSTRRRSSARYDFPFECEHCSMRTKTACGLLQHTGSKKCLDAQTKGRHLSLLHTHTKSPCRRAPAKNLSSGTSTVKHLFPSSPITPGPKPLRKRK